MSTTSAAKFHENFWGTENKGFDVLLQNMKAGINASKELGEFVKERIVTEDTYVKGLTKLQKSVQHIPEATLGTFNPLWELLKTMCDKLVKVHGQFVKMLSDLSREISDYHHTQKEKIKSNIRGDIEHAQEALQKYQATETSVHRSKKHYLQSAEEAIKARVKLEKIKVEASSNPKLKQRLTELEVRAKQSQAWMNTQKSDHQEVVKQHCGMLMEFQGKMSEACMKFESLEEEHLAQMVTFMIKIARTQDTTHSNQAEVFTILNSEMDTWTVEKLLKEFVEKKGTGKEKPNPHKFREADDSEASSLNLPVKTSQISRSTENLSASERRDSKTERKATFRPFGKKKKHSISQATGASSNGTTAETPEQQAAGPEVDAEGYSIRPEDAANISKFPDDPWGKKDDFSDSSDSEDEREKKIRAIKIRENSAQPAATIDDLKASVKNLKLGAVSPTGMRKASSSQSLNILTSTTATTTARRSANTSGVSETKPDHDQSQPSLLDLDAVFSSNGGGASQMPTPLKPTSSTASKTPHIAPPLLPSPPLGIRGAGATSGGSSAGGGPVIATTSFNTKPLDPSASLPPWSFSSPPAAVPNLSSSSILTPTSVPTTAAQDTSSNTATFSTDPSTSAPQNTGSTSNILDISSLAEPTITRPRSNSLKSEDSLANSIPAPPVPAKRRTRGGTIGPVKPIIPSANSPILAPQTPPLQPAKMSNGQDSQSPKIPSLNSSVQTPPLSPANRGASLLQMSHNASLPNSSLSPLVTSKTMNNSSDSNTRAQKQIPLAVAVIETCNAIFKGVDMDSCMVKVTGEVCLSFPSSYLSKISPSAPLQFKVEKKRLKLERVLHNQHLLKKGDEEGVFVFNMSALTDYLTKMKEKEANKSYYIIPALKYDVQVSGGGLKLPLQLKSYMKCEQTVTNFRVDYTYDSSVFTAASASKKPDLTKVVFSVPVDGGVQNSVSKPNGSWLADKETLTWNVGSLPAGDSPVSGQLQAKFSVASGPSHPSTAVVTFECEGASFSGLGVELMGSDYTMYLFKERCQSGKYLSEPKI